MNLDEFRMALSSDATIENEKLKSELKDLREETKREIIELKNKNEEYEQWCKQLGRRCFVHTGGAMCMSCGIGCCDYMLTYEDWDAITNYIRKNKLPRTPETYEKVIEFMKDRRSKK